jgi:hypothetical protein
MVDETSAFRAPVDVSGIWSFEVSTTATRNPRTPHVTFRQDGNILEGHYSSWFGDSVIRGTIDGRHVDFTVSLKNVFQRMIDVHYTGTVNDDHSIQGSLEIPEPMGTGTFLARRQPAAG